MISKFILNRRITMLGFLILLTGCQQNVRKIKEAEPANIPAIELQVQQLSAIAGGSYYLKEKCHHSDLPSNEQLLARVIALGDERGWPTKAEEYQQLPVKSVMIYEALVADSTPVEQQCYYFTQNISHYFKK